MVIAPEKLPNMSADELREVVQSLFQTLTFKQATIDKLTHENAILKRLKFAAQSERFSAEQRSLLEETLDADLQAVNDEIEQLQRDDTAPPKAKQQPKRQVLPANLPRTDIHHEPDSTTCQCGCQLKRIGEDVAEKLDYVPGVFSVERHIRGKWACAQCETLTQAPVDAHVIDKGIPTTGLLAQVLVAKFADHLPLYRQEAIFGRAGLAIPRSTLGAWVGSCGVQLQPLVDALKAQILSHSVVHADETPVQMLKPGTGKTHRAYLWAYAAGAFEDTKAVVYDFCDSRAGENAKVFLGDWRGSLVCDDFSGYKQLMSQGVTEVGCLAHARRKFFDLHVSNKSQIAHSALEQIAIKQHLFCKFRFWF
jgi:transposase